MPLVPQMAELMELASRATDEHIAKLPETQKPFVKMLRAMARQVEADREAEAAARNASSRFVPVD